MPAVWRHGTQMVAGSKLTEIGVHYMINNVEYYVAILERYGDRTWQWLQRAQIMAANMSEKSVSTAVFDE